MEIFCNFINVFTITFDQFSASFLMLFQTLTPTFWTVVYTVCSFFFFISLTGTRHIHTLDHTNKCLYVCKCVEWNY